MSFNAYPKISFVHNKDKIVLESAMAYYDVRSKQLFVVPEGFISDGCSIPQALWSVLGHPFSKEVRVAAILHDFLYRNNVISRKKADQMFFDALVSEGMSEELAQAFYLGVRLGGASAYNKE